MANKPFFVPQKEINLIDSMNEELIDEIVGQTVDIYKISVEDTDDNIYGESSTKYYNDGFRVNCLINWSEPSVDQDEFGADVNTSIEMYFHRTTLKEAGFFLKIRIRSIKLRNFFSYYFLYSHYLGLSSICNDDNLLLLAVAFI